VSVTNIQQNKLVVLDEERTKPPNGRYKHFVFFIDDNKIEILNAITMRFIHIREINKQFADLPNDNCHVIASEEMVVFHFPAKIYFVIDGNYIWKTTR
jgi:hypothetical protein